VAITVDSLGLIVGPPRVKRQTERVHIAYCCVECLISVEASKRTELKTLSWVLILEGDEPSCDMAGMQSASMVDRTGVQVGGQVAGVIVDC
jgi:hypothetical protein